MGQGEWFFFGIKNTCSGDAEEGYLDCLEYARKNGYLNIRYVHHD